MNDAQLALWHSRIGLAPTRQIDLASVTAYHQAQLASLPFDGLDPLFGRVPSLDLSDIIEKILVHHRGGYCFELNAVLAAGLRGVGFQVSDHLARVMWGLPGPLPRTHHTLTVRVDGQCWLVDAGFAGPTPTVPVPMDGGEVWDRGVGFRVESGDDLGHRLDRAEAGQGWRPVYAFTAEPAGPADFEAANWLAATWSGAPFVRIALGARLVDGAMVSMANVTCARASADGRVVPNDLHPDAALTVFLGELGIRLAAEDTAFLQDHLGKLSA